MSTSSQKKGKRSRESIEPNTTLFQSFKSKVQELFPISKWLSSPSTSNTNGSVKRSEDGTDSSSEEDMIQPPTKRMRYSAMSADFSRQYIPNEENATEAAVEHFQSTTVHSPQSSTLFRLDQANFASTPLQQNSETIDRNSQEHSAFEPQHSQMPGRTIAAKRKSLFGNDEDSNMSRSASLTSSNTLQDLKKPYFKSTLLSSTFYPGETTYGGASSPYLRRKKLNTRKNIVVNTAHDCDNTSTMSESTKRIMGLIEQYSSPLQEARRMSQFMDETKSSSPNKLSRKSYREELKVPGIASILSMKKRRLMETTSAARQIIASHSSMSEYPHYSQEISMRSSPPSLTKEKSSSANNKVDDVSENKRTQKSYSTVEEQKITNFSSNNNVSLFGPQKITSSSHLVIQKNKNEDAHENERTLSAKASNAVKSSPGLFTQNNDTTTTAAFKFSSPVKIATESTNHEIKAQKFTFGYPDSCKVKDKEETLKPSASLENVTEQKQITVKSTWKCEECWVSNKMEVVVCVCCGVKKQEADKQKKKLIPKCSVCKVVDSQANSNKCSNCLKIEINSIKTQESKTRSQPSTWKCEDCWVNNEGNADKCVCCGGKNTKKSSSPVISKEPTIKTTDSAHNNSMPKPASKWKCQDCWVSNDENVDKCVCCGGKKPTTTASNVNNKGDHITPISSQNTSTPVKPIDNSFKNIVKSQTDKWECPSCLVRNDSKQEKCACCEAEKPGTQKKETLKTFNFGVVPNTFKFGIDPNVQGSDKQSEQNESVKQIETKHEESEKNNNIPTKVSTFTFALPQKKVDDLQTKEKIAEVPKANFSFGVPKQINNSGSLLTNDKNINSSSKADESESVQEVPKVNLVTSTPKADLSDTPKTFTDTKASSAYDKPSTGFKLPSVLPKNLNPTIEKNKVTGLETGQLTSKTSEVNTFGFSKSSTSIAFGKIAATTTSNALFEKPDQLVTTSSTLQTDTTNTPFKFSSSSEQQAEKPKFNFSFNANKSTDAAPTFQFGSTGHVKTTQESTPAVNTFTSPIVNSLGSGNATPAVNLLSNNNNPLSGNPTQGVTLGNGPVNSISSGMPSNPLLSNNSATQSASTGLFGQKDNNMWSASNNSTNLFASNAPGNSQKPAFNFGTSTPFGGSNNGTKFGAVTTNNSQTAAFGSSTPQANVFGTPTQTQPGSAPSLFSSPAPAQNAPPAIFGGQQPVNNPLTSIGVFGTPSAATFGTSNSSLPSFEVPPANPTPTPSFNFTGQTPAVFGFGQQQQSSPNPVAFSFGASPAPVQFNMGSSTASNTAVAGRRMRKAIRRTQR